MRRRAETLGDLRRAPCVSARGLREPMRSATEPRHVVGAGVRFHLDGEPELAPAVHSAGEGGYLGEACEHQLESGEPCADSAAGDDDDGIGPV